MPMSPRERIEAALTHREPDRTPVFEYVLLSPVADALLGHRYAGDPACWDELIREVGWEESVRRSARDQVALAAALGWDMLYVVPNALPPGDPAYQRREDPKTEDPVENLRSRNHCAAQATPRTDDGFLVYRLIKEEMSRRGSDLPLLAPAYGHGVWTDVDLMQTMVLAPEVAHEHFALATRRSLAYVTKYIELGIDQVGVGGDFAGNRPLISPEAYRRFIVPEVRSVARAVHAAGLRAINASDGNLWSVIDDFLLGCEVDGYLEIDLHAGMGLRRLKDTFGDRITLYGNLDCGNTLSFGTEAQVRRHTIECLEAGQGRGGHILCASNAITAGVPLGNYLTMVNSYREFFRLKEFCPP